MSNNKISLGPTVAQQARAHERLMARAKSTSAAPGDGSEAVHEGVASTEPVPSHAMGEARHADATDLFEAFEAALVEGTPTLALQQGRIWIDGETAFDARTLLAALTPQPDPVIHGLEDGSARDFAPQPEPLTVPDAAASADGWERFSLADQRFLDPGAEVLVRFKVTRGAQNDYRGLYYILGDDPLEDPTEGTAEDRQPPILTTRIVAIRREGQSHG